MIETGHFVHDYLDKPDMHMAGIAKDFGVDAEGGRSRVTLAALIVAMIVADAPAIARAQAYSVVAVDPPTRQGEANDINNANQVVGDYMVMPLLRRGFLYSGGATTSLGTFSGFGSSMAIRINDAGTITGEADVASGASHAFVYRAGTMTDLGTLPGYAYSSGAGIDGVGRVVGLAANLVVGAVQTGFLWDGTALSPLPFQGTFGTGVVDINAAGTIVGQQSVAGGRIHAFAYIAGVMNDLGTLPGDTDSYARRVRADGVIVGYSEDATSRPSAVRWSAGTIAPLGSLPGGNWSIAEAINTAGVIVGASRDASGTQRAVRWSAGTIVDLNTQIAATSGWTLTGAAGINDNGWIVGQGTFGGVQRAFLLQPMSTDTMPPAIACAPADGIWHATNVAIACTATDGGSGLADPADAAFSLATSVAAGAESDNATTSSRNVCDNAGNCAMAGPIAGNKIDRKPPTITVSAPGNTVAFNSTQLASFSCSDAGSGVASCIGTVANGAPVDTLAVGTQSFTVTATDVVGNVATTVVQYQVVATSWPQFHNGAARTGVQPNEKAIDLANVAALRPAWQGRTRNKIWSSPVVADGVVYATSYDGELHAFSAANGRQLWTSGRIGRDLFASPAVDRGRVFAGSDNGDLYAFDAATGRQLWRFPAGSEVVNGIALDNGIVYAGTRKGIVYAIDAANGRLIWSQTLPYGGLFSGIAVDKGVLYVACEDLFALDASTGQRLWTASCAPCSLHATPAVFQAYVLAAGDDGNLYAFDRAGNPRWSALTTYARNIVGTPAVDGSLAYVSATDGSLYAFDLATGAKVWSTVLLATALWSSPAYANGLLYIGVGRSELIALDAKTGRIVWRAPVRVIYSSPAVADGTVYIGAEDGAIHAFRH